MNTSRSRGTERSRGRPPSSGTRSRRTRSAFSFGEYDVVSIVDLPDNVTAAAVVIKAVAGRALKDVRTTPLLTVEESIEALTRAQGVEYQPPGNTGFQTPIYAG